MSTHLFRLAASLVLLFGLAACGGGGGGGGAAVPQSPATTSPTGVPSTASPTPTQSAQVFIDATSSGATIARDAFGTNLSAGDDPTNPALPSLFKGAGLAMIRWPGGTPSDGYHWQTNTWSAMPCQFGGTPNPNAAFDSFMKSLIQPNGFDVAITVNYGSNPSCTSGADPNEAAAWVNYANNTQHYGIKYWTVGNEQYFGVPPEIDAYTPTADPTRYASLVANSFYPLMKAADPSIQIGVDLAAPLMGTNPNWDSYVLANAKYDFVEIHVYPQATGTENDNTLLTQGPANLTQGFTQARSELAAVGKPNTPIMLGEFGSVSGDPGKQSLSIVDGLFMGMAIGETLNAGIPIATYSMGTTAVCGVGNQSSSLYGWQNFGTYSLFSGGTPAYACPSAQTTAYGTPFPGARAYQLASQFAMPGQHMLTASVSSAQPNLRAYGATQSGGYALFIFNLDSTNSAATTVGVLHATQTSFTATTIQYGKTQYDQSQSGTWAAPVVVSLGSVSNPLPLTLPPWSMTVVQLVSTTGASVHARQDR